MCSTGSHRVAVVAAEEVVEEGAVDLLFAGSATSRGMFAVIAHSVSSRKTDEGRTYRA